MSLKNIFQSDLLENNLLFSIVDKSGVDDDSPREDDVNVVDDELVTMLEIGLVEKVFDDWVVDIAVDVVKHDEGALKKSFSVYFLCFFKKFAIKKNFWEPIEIFVSLPDTLFFFTYFCSLNLFYYHL